MRQKIICSWQSLLYHILGTVVNCVHFKIKKLNLNCTAFATLHPSPPVILRLCFKGTLAQVHSTGCQAVCNGCHVCVMCTGAHIMRLQSVQCNGERCVQKGPIARARCNECDLYALELRHFGQRPARRREICRCAMRAVVSAKERNLPTDAPLSGIHRRTHRFVESLRAQNLTLGSWCLSMPKGKQRAPLGDKHRRTV